jgi:hypothetical protein
MARSDRPDRDAPHSDDRSERQREFSNRDWERANEPTDPEKRRKYRERWSATLLPGLPHKEGWHRCWVSTSHSSDTVARRIANGYRVIMVDELTPQGWSPENDSMKDAKFSDGAARWREMIAMECPEEEYQDYMREFHHDQPLDMVRDIYAPLEETRERIQDAGGRMEFSDGLRNLQKFRRAPRQFE